MSIWRRWGFSGGQYRPGHICRVSYLCFDSAFDGRIDSMEFWWWLHLFVHVELAEPKVSEMPKYFGQQHKVS